MTPVRCSARGLRRAAVIALALLLGACGSLPRHPLNTDFAQRNWAIRLSNIAAVQSFALQGRLAESGLTGARGNIDWSQSGERFDVHVSGPLGVGALALTGDPRSVEIRTKDGVFVTGSPESFMQQRLGWSLPLMPLRYWVLGVPAPGRFDAPDPTESADGTPRPRLLLDDAGRAQTIRQFGWQVDYEDYQTVGPLSLPKKLTLASGSRSFRIVIDQWSGTP